MKQLLVIILCVLCIFSIAFADTMLNPFTGKMDFVGAAGDPVAVNWDDLEDVINDAAINWTAVQEIGDDNINWTDIPNITIAGTMTADSFVSTGAGQSSVDGLIVNPDEGGAATNDFYVNTDNVVRAFHCDAANDWCTHNTTLRLKEIAEADTDTAGYGQLWAKAATPSELWFTDDAGTDFQLGVAGSVNWEAVDDEIGDQQINWTDVEEISGSNLVANIAITSTGVQDYGGATSFEIPNSADPDVDALGEISYDSDDFAIRAYDGTNQIAVGQKNHQISKTLYKPNDMSNNGLIVLWRNISGFVYNITRIFAGSDTANVEFSIFKVTGTSTGVNWESVTEIEPIVIDTTVLGDNGINWSTSNLTSGINWTTINSEDSIGINWSSASDPDWVNLEIQGWYNADVN
jgi:hypothetical protein